MLPSLLSQDQYPNRGQKEKLIDKSLQNYFRSFPEEGKIRELLRNAFVINRPLLGVGGDGYWLHEVEGSVYLVVFDCTGHGRVASIMTRLYINVIKFAIIETKLQDPGKILELIHEKIGEEFKDKENLSVGSGADMLVARIHKDSRQLSFASAKMDFVYSVNGVVNRLKAIKGELQIGEHFHKKHEYTTRTFNWSSDNVTHLYIYSDGVTDLIGGPQERKLGYANWQEILQQAQRRPFQEQKEEIEKSFSYWLGPNEPFDDLLCMGIML